MSTSRPTPPQPAAPPITIVAKPFRLCNSKVHLTYKTHIDFEFFKTTIISKLPPLKMLSFVHEEGDDQEDADTPYAHTHVFMWTKTPMDTIDTKYFDVPDADGHPIHPNITNHRSLVWAKTIVLNYHLGHKTKKDGKKYYIEPIWLHQEGVAEWKMEEDAWAIAEQAPSVKEACMELGIGAKTIADVEKVRHLNGKRKADTIDEDADPANFKTVEWDRKKALVLRGPSGTCKINWAIYQFTKPMKIEDLDELKSIPDGCDGLIFDECLFDKCSKKTMVALTDYKQPRTVRTRNTNASIPRGMSKIFTCNEHEHPFGYDAATGGHPAVTSRYVLMDVVHGDLVTANSAR